LIGAIGASDHDSPCSYYGKDYRRLRGVLEELDELAPKHLWERRM